MTNDDSHLDNPAIGDFVEFTAQGTWGRVDALGTITRVMPTARKVDVCTEDGYSYRGIRFDDIFVLRKSA
ncbi:MAG: hypothetical protein GC185_01710 [Alphaproteobacteria bacterium]|nr:hypothetical protein [Alphaproteobacteria bacterium]